MVVGKYKLSYIAVWNAMNINLHKSAKNKIELKDAM